MKRAFVVALALALITGAMTASVDAKAKKKKKAPKPIATTLFAHGTEPLGELDQGPTSGQFLTLDATEPSGGQSKSILIWGVGAGGTGTPNKKCGGNSLMPVFVGKLTGRVTGDLKFTFSIASTPGTVEVRVWPDLAAQACNDSFIEPTAAVEVAVPPGKNMVTATLEGVDFTATSGVMIQITPTHATPMLGRVFYDSTADLTKLELLCTPTSGTSCTP